MSESLFKDLVAFIYDKTGTRDIPIAPDTEIEADLGITGDDGEELIVHFSKRYNVNIDNFYFNRYFYPEPQYFGVSIRDKIEILRVRHLLKAIDAGRLDDAVINS